MARCGRMTGRPDTQPVPQRSGNLRQGYACVITPGPVGMDKHEEPCPEFPTPPDEGIEGVEDPYLCLNERPL